MRPLLETTDGNSILLGTIYCIGRNYPDHAREMNASVPDEPIVFLKPATSFIPTGGTILVPSGDHLVHHEVELVAVIGEPLHQATCQHAQRAIVGYAVGVDVTLRDLQAYAKAHGLPWALAKGFATSAPISPVVPAQQVEPIEQKEFGLAVNGQLRQRATPAAMIWPVPELVAYLSQWFVLQPGDVVFTGSPEGVGPLTDGDLVHAWLGDYATLEIHVRQRQ